jgi:2-polyprenyl-6-methoxyphenol hydroxylase-like FAD-dependent oxidoreductase
MDWPLSRAEVNLFFSPQGLMVVAPLPGEGHFRIVASAEDAPELPSAHYTQSLLDRRGPSVNPGRIRDVLWSSRFRIYHRVAESPRMGRILLCGDAAHVHSGVSLAEALTQTLKDGDDARLDTWAADRHGVASDVVALTDRMTRMATMKSGTGQILRNIAIAFAGHLPPVRAALAKTLAELNTR